MKMLAISAQTIPLWVGRDGEEPPELCGCIPADASFTAEQVCARLQFRNGSNIFRLIALAPPLPPTP